jgi:hypothetical protein
MSTTTISPLRQRMIEGMTARKFGPASQSRARSMLFPHRTISYSTTA